MIEQLRRLGLVPAASSGMAWPRLRWPEIRLRMVDAVVVAGAAMLLLKGTALVSHHFSADPAPAAGQSGRPPEPPSFARVLAHARTNYVPPEVATTGAVPPKKDEAPQKASGAPAVPQTAEPVVKAEAAAERALLERLGERRDELQQRNRDIEMRERLIENAERKLETRINELRTLESKAQDASKRAEADPGLRNLVSMYETMKPKEAARVFDRLSLDVLVPVVAQMNPRKMAEVLAAMTPEAASKLTAALANRSKAGEPRAAAGAAALPVGELQAIDPPARAPR